MIENEIGKLAGEIWDFLNQQDNSTAMQIRVALGCSNSQLFLSLGWLLRENKIAISKHENNFQVSLRK